MNLLNLNSNSGIITVDHQSISTNFSEFTLIHESEKGYCRLFKAKKLGKWHVLKILKSDYANNPLYQSLFRKEFEIAYPLSHPHIIQTIGIEYVSELGLCIIMEYIDGINLREFLLIDRMERSTAMKLINSLCDALEYIHNLQIIHRDLKPENILITRNGFNLKLIDFGLSDTDAYAILKQPAGTLGYASPEPQIKDSIVDNRSDIYSLGIILEEINNNTETIKKLKWIINRCKLKDKNKRFSTIREIILLIKKENRNKGIIVSSVILLLITNILFLWFSFRNKPEIQTQKNINFKKTIDNKSQNENAIPSSSYARIDTQNIYIYNQLAIDAKHLADIRCQNLYNRFDTISSQNARMDWFNEYSNLVREVNMEVDSILKTKISESKPEYILYKTSLFQLVEQTWEDYYYKNKEKFRYNSEQNE